MPHILPLRPLFGAIALSVAVAGLSGCSMFRSAPIYLESEESRPLEVPPDLVLPASSAALRIPPAAAGAPAPGEAPPASFGAGTAFELSDTSENAFRRVGLALKRIDGVTATQGVAALNSHEVTFKGESFLIRLSAQSDVVRVDAISPAGAALTGGAAGELLAALQSRLQ